MIKSLFQFVFSRWLALNLLIIGAFLAGVIWFIQRSLTSHTLHGQTITVPDFSGLKPDELDAFIDGKQVRYEIVDSVFMEGKARGVIVEQSPLANSLVKDNRKVYLTVNAKSKQRVAVPEVADASLKQALSILESYGIRIANKIYVPSEHVGNVIRIERNGKEIPAGTMIEKGTRVDLVVGQGESDEVIPMPMLKGKTYAESKEYMRDKAVNLLAINWTGCATAKDSSAAVVVRQDPEWTEHATINLGKSINVWLSCEQTQ